MGAQGVRFVGMISRQTCFGRRICPYLNTLQPPGFDVVDMVRLIRHVPQLPCHSGFSIRCATRMGFSPRDFHRLIPGVSQIQVSYPLWKRWSNKKKSFEATDTFVCLFLAAPPYFLLFIIFIFWGHSFDRLYLFIASCACYHSRLACNSLFVLNIEPPQQQASML